MTREEYAKRMKKHPDWAPGRDAIEAAFAKRYPKTEPVCFESELHDRAAFGGDEYLDGFAVYDTGRGYQHIVTYGMSELYPSMAAFGAEYSKWGYEMTMKVRESYAETGTWALDLLAQLARYRPAITSSRAHTSPATAAPCTRSWARPSRGWPSSATRPSPRSKRYTAGLHFCSSSVSRSRNWMRSRATRTH